MANAAVIGNTPFLWEGTDRNGKKIKGKSLAKDESSVRADLRRQGAGVQAAAQNLRQVFQA